MKKRYLKVVLILNFLLLMLIIPNRAFAVTTSGDYEILSYNVNINVNENNTFDITENITTNFSKAKHRNF